MIRRGGRPALAALVALTLAGCSGDEEARLQGERIPLRETGAQMGAEAEIRPVPEARARDAWTQRGGGPQNEGGHAAAPETLRAAWAVDIGAGPGERLATSGPVVAEGRVYARDGEAGVLAFDAQTGAELWEADLTPEGEYAESGFGGGVAYDDGRIFATTGFGEVVALSPSDGAELWRVAVDAPFRAAPAAADGRVIAVARDDEAVALDQETGERLWRMRSGLARAGNLGLAAPAAASGVAALPFGSGELMLVRAGAGSGAWTVTVVSRGSVEGLAAFPDVTSDPALVQGPQGPMVVAGNAGGALAAWAAPTGRRIWQRDFGSLSPVWPAGDTLYVVTSEPAVQRLDLGDGHTLWRAPLPAYGDPDDRTEPIGYAGPVLAGGRVLVTASDGRLLAFDPRTGEPLETIDLPSGASVGPAVAGGSVYVLTDSGELVAYR